MLWEMNGGHSIFLSQAPSPVAARKVSLFYNLKIKLIRKSKKKGGGRWYKKDQQALDWRTML